MRKPASQPRPRLDDLPTPELVCQGDALLSARDYKGAIDIYKLLLKREPQASWREPLAVAYLERARQLAQKEMYREAAVLWENIPSLCGQAPTGSIRGLAAALQSVRQGHARLQRLCRRAIDR